jgi:hypothetical protein
VLIIHVIPHAGFVKQVKTDFVWRNILESLPTSPNESRKHPVQPYPSKGYGSWNPALIQYPGAR